MKAFFSFVTRTALRFRAITLMLVAVVIVAGSIAAVELQQELLPPVEFPQTIIFAQVSGMNSDEVLEIVTKRIENALASVPEIVNIESTSNGAIGAFIIAANNFGQDQVALRAEIQGALDTIWFPQRRITPPDGESPTAFAQRLLAALDAEALLYIAQRDPNFLFQLQADIWNALSPDTVQQLLAYLADQRDNNADKTILERLVEQEVVPQLNAIRSVANVRVDGGQALPEEEETSLASVTTAAEDQPLIFKLSPTVWQVASARAGLEAQLNDDTLTALASIEYTIPATVPALPATWQMDHFTTVADLIEVGRGARSLATILNNFLVSGNITGALGQTDDLTPEAVTQMLELAPSMVNYFRSEHLVALPPEVFAVLPNDFVDNLDGFTRDEIASIVLAEAITGQSLEIPPVNLPNPWRISPPTIISFSFADIPLATFSVFDNRPATPETEEANEAIQETDTQAVSDSTETDSTPQTSTEALPVGPDLPRIFNLMGQFLGAELNTADDFVTIEINGPLADTFGSNSLTGVQFLNLLTQFSDLPVAGQGDPTAPALDIDIASFIPALVECGVGLLDIDPQNPDIAQYVIGCLPADVAQYLLDYAPDFPSGLQPAVYEYLSPEVLALDGISPPLADVWRTLAQRPQFNNQPLRYADDLLMLGEGSAAQVLDTINRSVPLRFAGYEVRLFDSLTPTVINYLASNEPDFFETLDDDILLKLSPEVLAILPENAIAALDDDLASQVMAIASGQQASAAEELASLYQTEVPPTDPDAPLLGPAWQTIVPFVPGVEALDNASDLLRFPNATGAPAQFINSFLTGPGATLAPQLLAGLSTEAIEYISQRDNNFLNDLEPGALQLLTPDVLATLPESIQERAAATEIFRPTTQITRTNGASSLLVTVFKDADANTVQAFYEVLEIINKINAENDEIAVSVAFEQSSFVETSIAGVVREGTLGAFFAIINILVFLSGGLWGLRGRRIVGVIIIAISIALMALLIALQLNNTGGNIGLAFEQADTVMRIIAILGFIAGLVILIYPGALPYPSWRSTLVIGVSIPLSILAALALMRWFPLSAGLTLNIMTLSGLTVAVGRVVDDSIVVLENIFRQIQTGMDKAEAILSGVRDVSVAIFSATSIAVVVFLPLGLTGGIIGEFFLPFGLAVTYALLSSFLVAITVIPVLAYLFISSDDVPPESETWMQRLYVPTLRATLHNNVTRWGVVILAVVSAGFGAYLFANRPAAFLPDFGEPQITVAIAMPDTVGIIETNNLVVSMEQVIDETIPENDRIAVRSTVGGGGLGFAALFGGGGVQENQANIAIGIREQSKLEEYTLALRGQAEAIFGEENVTVSATTLTSGGGFGGFELVLSGEDQAVLEEYDQQIIDVLNSIDGITNVTSNLSEAGSGESVSYLRTNRQPAVSYTGELETEDTLGITQRALETLRENIDLPPGYNIGQGFDSEVQSEGFGGVFVAMGIAIVIVVAILILVFGSPIYWLAVIFSIIVAPVGAAIALTLTERVLGISALIGLLMLLGLVVTNAVVLIDRVGSNRFERGLSLYDALIEAGSRRVRPILMTALATIIALIPLAVGLSEGAIIASELGTVVIGGVLSSTLLTLIVTPAAYYLFTPLHDTFFRLLGRDKSAATKTKV